nr:glycosyltransferase family 4 protein [Akkermansiaceae bacterium]
MKVVQILPELNAGGVERGTLELAAYLRANGHEAVVISNGGRLEAALEAAGGRHVALPVHRKHPSSLLQVRPLRRWLRNEAPDILHVRSRVPAWIAWLAWRKLAAAERPAFVSTVHGFYSVNRYSAIMTRGERVIAVSRSVKDYILGNYPSVPEEAVRVIPRGIRPEDYRGFQPSGDWLARWRAEQPQLAGRKVLLLCGRVTRLKGHEDFLRLIAGLKAGGTPVYGLVVGDVHPSKRAYLEELGRLATKLGIAGEVTFLGHRADVREIMAASDLICALSRQPESFGRTVLEALALGKPVAGYDCGGVGELLAEFLPAGRVPPGDGEALLATARALLAAPPAPAVV